MRGAKIRAERMARRRGPKVWRMKAEVRSEEMGRERELERTRGRRKREGRV